MQHLTNANIEIGTAMEGGYFGGISRNAQTLEKVI
jgi:hypothetical protein